MAQTLYRFYGKAGDLLYVGITLDPPMRFRSHSYSQEWWVQVADIRLESYPDRKSVRVAEEDAIKRERPRYNVLHNMPEALAPAGGQEIRWTCEKCKRSIGPREGSIYVLWRDIAEYDAGLRAAKGKRETLEKCVIVSLADMNAVPEIAHWHVQHERCNQDPQADAYWIGVEDWSNASEGFDWAAHLVEKRWIQSTDFDALLRRLSRALQPARKSKKSRGASG